MNLNIPQSRKVLATPSITRAIAVLAEKLQGTGNRGRMWGNSEKCEFGLTKTVKETLYENWRQIEKHTKS